MRLISLGVGAAVFLAAGAAASQTADERLAPPKEGEWRSTFLVCAEGKRMTAGFYGPDKLTVTTPEGEHRLTRVEGGAPTRYRNEKAELVIDRGRAQFTGARKGPHKDCKPS